MEAVIDDLEHLAFTEAGHECSNPAQEDGNVDGPDELTCAICLEQIAPVDLAVVKGCDHLYCVHCILQWALCKENVTCPQCKTPFNYLYIHRLLDGTVMDFPVEESVCLLKRAKWFEEHVKTQEKGLPIKASDFQYEQDYEYDYDEDDEDDEIERYYFSSAAGRARVVIGNRRWGENGVVRSGRMYARPVQQQQQAPPSSGKSKGSKAAGASKGSGTSTSNVGGTGMSDAAGSAAAAAAAAPQPTAAFTSAAAPSFSPPPPPAAAAAAGPSPGAAATASGSGAGSSSAAKQKGRRAKRSARRAVADTDDYPDYDDYYGYDY